MLDDRVPRVSGHVQDANSRPLRRQAIGELPPGQPRHHDVGQEEMDGAAMALDDAKCGGGIGGGQDDVTLGFERAPAERQNRRFVFYDQHRFAAAGGAGCLR